ncbi:polysaccharide deacetylase family protein [Nocardioides caldifontis]|uniref:polysaccharide deacetylase family protein n=1 Tax=Nocardioides caldifontis TaxID=2588938 RepID=UPI0011E053CA|nr:polysaccharide deacetylase family protein [Nocardioides caldifontis]
MTVLCYHAVQPGWTAPMSMEPAVFAEHARWLARHRRVVPLHAYVDRLGLGAGPRWRDVALTFDDGFASVHDHALPLLVELGLPATVFLVASTIVEPGRLVDWVDRPPAEPLATLEIDQIREMQEAGVAFESHSYWHHDLTTLSFAECVEDLRASREVLEEVLGHPVRLLAYPRGRHDGDVRAAAASAGYTHAFALPEQREEPGRFAVPRVGIYHDNTIAHLRIKLARPYLAVRSLPALAASRRASSR